MCKTHARGVGFVFLSDLRFYDLTNLSIHPGNRRCRDDGYDHGLDSHGDAIANPQLTTLELMIPTIYPMRLASLAWLALFCEGAHAATVTKSDTNSLRANATNWSASPANTDTGSFTNTLSASNASNLTLGGTNLSIGTLSFSNAMNGPVVITDTASLILNNYSTTAASYTIAAASANQNIIFNLPVEFTNASGGILESNYTNAGQSITFNGSVTSAGKVYLRAGNATFAGGGNYTSIGVGSRTGVTSTIRIGANNGISTSATMNVGEANGTSRFDLAGYHQSLAGINKVNSGTTAIIGNSSTTSNSVLTLTGTSSYSGIIQDSIDSGNKNVGLVINGGALTLTANNTYTGDTIIKSGSLKLDAAGRIQQSRNVIIGDSGSSGATLDVTTISTGFIIGSSQTVGGIGHLDASGKTVAVSGKLAPGNSAGKFHVTTSGLSFSSTGILSLELTRGVTPNAGMNYDQLDLIGSLTIDPSATLEFTALGSGAWQNNDLFFLILNDGTDAISGSFSGFAEGSIFTLGSQSFRLTYQADSSSSSFTGGNDMAIQAIPESSHVFIFGMGVLLFSRRRR